MKKKDGPTMMDLIWRAEARIAELKTEVKRKDEEIVFLRLENSQLGEEYEKLKDERAYLQRLCATHEAKIESLEKDREILRGKIGELHKRLNTGRGPGRRREMYDLQEKLVEVVKGAVEVWYCGEE